MMLAAARRTARLLLLAAAGLAAACGPSEEHAPPSGEATAVEEEAADTTPARPASFFGETAQAYTIAGFQHNPHTNVACTNCHSGMPGHAAHSGVACVECHGGEAAETVPASMPRAECQACHHRADPPRDCARCHAPQEIAPSIVVPASIVAAGRTRERELGFEHERHSALACTRCHELPDVTPVRACATCHDNHHRADAECSLCHPPPSTSHHDLATHRSCAGSGCHADATVLALPLSRTLCLVCHADRRDHEPGQECAQCHLIRDEAKPAASGPWQHAPKVRAP